MIRHTLALLKFERGWDGWRVYLSNQDVNVARIADGVLIDAAHPLGNAVAGDGNGNRPLTPVNEINAYLSLPFRQPCPAYLRNLGRKRDPPDQRP